MMLWEEKETGAIMTKRKYEISPDLQGIVYKNGKSDIYTYFGGWKVW